jgi:diaminopimelate epimerase
MEQIRFHKYQALENDFLVVELSGNPPHVVEDTVARKRPQGAKLQRGSMGDRSGEGLAEAICDRHRGIGADGVIFFGAAAGRFEMRVFNADGSEAEISGNGLRILAQHLYQKKYVSNKSFVIHSATGDNTVAIISSRGPKAVSRISLRKPRFALAAIPMTGTTDFFINSAFAVSGGELAGTAVNVGNPHIVFFVDNFDFDWEAFGKEVECDRRFPMRTNVEFAVIRSRRQVIHRSWERGVGVTRASGTGAASTVAAGIINGIFDHEVTVCEPAGELQIVIPSLDNDILLSGPSEYVGEGNFIYDGNEKDTR